MKVLIVDDSLVSRMMVKKCIVEAGVGIDQFAFAGDGAQALELLEAGGIDILVSDLNMPVMDGLELVRALKDSAVPRPRRIIIVTSAVGQDLIAELGRVQVDGVICKPVTPSAFAQAFAGLHDPGPPPPP